MSQSSRYIFSDFMIFFHGNSREEKSPRAWFFFSSSVILNHWWRALKSRNLCFFSVQLETREFRLRPLTFTLLPCVSLPVVWFSGKWMTQSLRDQYNSVEFSLISSHKWAIRWKKVIEIRRKVFQENCEVMLIFPITVHSWHMLPAFECYTKGRSLLPRGLESYARNARDPWYFF